MEKRLYVGGVPYQTSADALKAHFEQAGPVESVELISDRMTGKSKGFGFVTMATADGASRAIEMFHGKPLEGRTLTVNMARPREERPSNR
jgi:RNA recognition motif-containing protein